MNAAKADTLAFALAYTITHGVFLTAFSPLYEQLRMTAPMIPAIMGIVFIVCIIILFIAAFGMFGLIGTLSSGDSNTGASNSNKGSAADKNKKNGLNADGSNPNGPLRVTILSPREGLPLALGARIPLLARVDNPGQDAIWEVTAPYSTPMRGKLGMFNRNAVRATLVAAKPGDMAIEVNVFDRTGSSQSRVTIKVIAGSTVSGIAMDASGHPIADANIEICAVGSDKPLTSIGDPQGNKQLIVKSGANGEFKFDSVPMNKPFIVRGHSKKHGYTRHFLPRLGKKANALMLTIENPVEDGVQVIFDEALVVEVKEVPGLLKKKDDIIELIDDVEAFEFIAEILGGTAPYQAKWTIEEITGVADGMPTTSKTVMTGSAVIDTVGPTTHTAKVKIDPTVIKALKETRKPFRIILEVTDMSMPQKKGKAIVGLENLTEPKAKFVKVADVELNDTNRNMWKNLAVPVPVAEAVEIHIEINGGFDDIEVQGAATRADARTGTLEPIRVDVDATPISVKGKKQTFKALVRALRAPRLSPGEYTVYVRAKDKRKQEADDTIRIQVGAAYGTSATNLQVEVVGYANGPAAPPPSMNPFRANQPLRARARIIGGIPPHKVRWMFQKHAVLVRRRVEKKFDKKGNLIDTEEHIDQEPLELDAVTFSAIPYEDTTKPGSGIYYVDLDIPFTDLGIPSDAMMASGFKRIFNGGVLYALVEDDSPSPVQQGAYIMIQYLDAGVDTSSSSGGSGSGSGSSGGSSGSGSSGVTANKVIISINEAVAGVHLQKNTRVTAYLDKNKTNKAQLFGGGDAEMTHPAGGDQDFIMMIESGTNIWVEAIYDFGGATPITQTKTAMVIIPSSGPTVIKFNF